MINKIQMQSEYLFKAGSTMAAVGVATNINLLSILGAGVGASIFIITRHNFQLSQKFFLFVISFFAGLGSAPTMMNLLYAFFGGSVEFDLFFGAMIAASVMVILLRGLISIVENPAKFILKINRIYQKLDIGIKRILTKLWGK